MMKRLTIVFLFISIGASAQTPVFWSLNYTNSSPLLLDTYGTNAVGAFSFRKLRTAYTGYCIEGIRASDGAKQKIGFVNGYLDTVSLKSFAGSSSVAIQQWYDQSGVGTSAVGNLGNNFVVINGDIVYLNGFVAVRSIGSGYQLSYPLSSYNVVFSAAKIDTFQRRNNIVSTAVGKELWYGGTAAGVTGIGGVSPAGTGNGDAESLNLLIAYHNFSSGNLIVSKNGGSDTNTGAFSSSFTTSTNLLGTAGITVDQLKGRAYEIILYSADKSADKTGIITNINNYYSIY